MPTKRMRRLYAALALGSSAAACDTTTAPDPAASFDTDEVLADYAAVDGVRASPGWDGFQALRGRMPFDASSPALRIVDAFPAAGDVAGGRAFALDLVRRLQSGFAEGPQRTPIISDRHRGGTFVYDPVSDVYVFDPDREGAPATGVRFLIYEVDAAGRPIVDREIGYADLVDEGDGSAEDIALRLIVVADETTVLDYRTTLDASLGRAAVTVRGFLQGDDGVRLDFDIGAVGTTTLGRSTLDVTFDLAVEARDFSISGRVTGVEEGSDGEGDVELLVRHRSHSIQLDMSGRAGQLDGSVHLDGELFATVTGDAGDPTILGATGKPLRLGEVLVLRQIVDTVEDVFDLLEDLVDPVDEIVILGIIL
jgi:hypothetical protein